MPPARYIFHHFPKTGGISLLSVCRYNLDRSEISPHLNGHEIRLKPAQFERYRLIAGHFSLLTHAEFCRSRYSMTLLRDPVRRIFSTYTFWRISSEHNFETSKAREFSFADFVRYFIDSPLINNNYVHHFAAIGTDCPGYPADATALLSAARHNLAAFDFVGFCEQLGRSIRLLCHELGWRVPAEIPHDNRSGSEASLGNIEPRTLDILRERNQLDSQLYDYATQLFDAREAIALAGSGTAAPRAVGTKRLVPFPIAYKVNRRAIIQFVSPTWVPDDSSKTLEITIAFTTIGSIAELSLDIQVNDVFGTIVWATSTERERLDLSCEVGCTCQATFLVECNLLAGEYLVSVGLSEPRRLGFFEHWIDHAASFTVAPPQAAESSNRNGMQLKGFSSSVVSKIEAADAGEPLSRSATGR